ncbi:hypothetical protein [Thiococcus pfennigii]|uniref:hypothetical protein n=1 Tax=Thiococcus pfennigii TaxID=1057 RepID=UPI0019043BB6|nr:hypothetical protein [Thiococcus pfennigii]
MKKHHPSNLGHHSLLPAIAVTGMSLALFLLLSFLSAPSDTVVHQGTSATATMR